MLTDKTLRSQYDFEDELISEKVASIQIPLVIAQVGSSRIVGSNIKKQPRVSSKNILSNFEEYLQNEKKAQRRKIQEYKSKQKNIGQGLLQHQTYKDRKLQQLREQQRNKMLQECTFKPKINNNNPKRNFSQFLSNQKQHVEKVNAKKENLKREIQSKKAQETYKPKINHKSIQDSLPVFQRLYGSRQKDNSFVGQKYSFQPTITEKSKKMERSLPIDELLYCDALRRQQKIREGPGTGFGSGSQVKETNLKKEKFAAQKFIKEYCLALNRLQTKGGKIDYLMFNQLLQNLGFIMNEEESQGMNATLERALVHKAYQLLEAREVNARNICVFLLALLGIYHINPVNFQEVQQDPLPQKELNFEVADGRRVQKEFDLLYRNRLSSEGMRKGEVQSIEYTFQPQINRESEQMAQKYRSKMLQEANVLLDKYPEIEFNIPEDGVITHSQLLILHRMAKDIQNQKKKVDNEDKLLSECTFKPLMCNSFQNINQPIDNSIIYQESSLGYKKSIELYNHHKSIEDKKKSLKASRQIGVTDKQCTFKPKINSQISKPPTAPFAKQSDEVIYRLRKGHEEHKHKMQLLERGQRSKGFDTSSSVRIDEGDSVDCETKPNLIIDVNMGEKIQQILIYKGDELRIPELARAFAEKHQLDPQSQMRLIDLLKVEIQSVLQKIDEGQESENDYQ